MHRNRWLLLGLVAAAVALLGLAATASAAEGKGIIRGSLANATVGGASVADQDVILTAYSGRVESGKQTARSDREGIVVFQGLETDPDLTYQLSVEYQGALYFSEPVTFPSDSTEQSAELQLFDATTDASVVTLTAAHYLVVPSPNELSVSEIAIVRNSTDRTYVGAAGSDPATRETLRFPVPAEAYDVEPSAGFLESQARLVDGGISDSWPVYPGDSQRVFRYRVAAQGDSAVFTARLSLPADRVSVLVPDVGVRVSVSNLPDRASRDMQGEKYLMLGGQKLAAGTELEFRLDGLSKARPAASSAGTPSSLGAMPLIAGGAVLVVLVAVAALLRRRRARSQEDEWEARPEEAEEAEWSDAEAEQGDLEAERQELIASIARLDDAFEAGSIGPEEYGRLRADRKRRLVEVAGRQRALATARSEP